MRARKQLNGCQHGPQGAASLIDLGLREVERILQLDVTGGDIVAAEHGYDPARVADNDGHFGFGGGLLRICADGNGLTGADAPGGCRLEEQLRALALVDAGIDALLPGALIVTRRGALVGDPRSPHLRRVNGHQQPRRVPGRRLRQVCERERVTYWHLGRNLAQPHAFLARPAHQRQSIGHTLGGDVMDSFTLHYAHSQAAVVSR